MLFQQSPPPPNTPGGMALIVSNGDEPDIFLAPTTIYSFRQVDKNMNIIHTFSEIEYNPQGNRTLPYPTLSYPILSYPILSYPTLPYPTLPYPTLPYPTLPYPTLQVQQAACALSMDGKSFVVFTPTELFFFYKGGVVLALSFPPSLPPLASAGWGQRRFKVAKESISENMMGSGQYGTYPTLPYTTLPYPTLPYPTLPYPTLPYPRRHELSAYLGHR